MAQCVEKRRLCGANGVTARFTVQHSVSGRIRSCISWSAFKRSVVCANALSVRNLFCNLTLEMDTILDGGWRRHKNHTVRLTAEMVQDMELPMFVVTYPKTFGAEWRLPQRRRAFTFVDFLLCVCLQPEHKLCARKPWLLNQLMQKQGVNKNAMAKVLVYTLAFIEHKEATKAMTALLPHLSQTNIQSMSFACIKHAAVNRDTLINAA